MADRQMFGVVLWSDDTDKKAVIWCEDHGNLAYYTHNEASDGTGLSLDAGDLIQFDVSEVRHMRLARNLRLIGQEQFPTLAQRLTGAVTASAALQGASNSNVIDARMRLRA
ncbi:hypothetical protein [Pseudoprimorskyibacter insulae]|uniref:Uncharacterized protein n=1 Tax=Pseudoprimorskyibacter insulae TaxID=1695997 RepID=A0A2R8AXC6_9RHOB|nr:hypothetical protein [Pseudoprimorskyibacter insulae]SPF80705.1 hypothetical protein PRI8871_02516 [Pseudoprimorskyibacter insulae]